MSTRHFVVAHSGGSPLALLFQHRCLKAPLRVRACCAVQGAARFPRRVLWLPTQSNRIPNQDQSDPAPCPGTTVVHDTGLQCARRRRECLARYGFYRSSRRSLEHTAASVHDLACASPHLQRMLTDASASTLQVLPFGAVFIELFFILSSVWLHQVSSPRQRRAPFHAVYGQRASLHAAMSPTTCSGPIVSRALSSHPKFAAA